MVNNLLSRCGLGLGVLSLAGCVEPYVPAVVDAPSSYLVVDGFINGNGVTRIKLSRTASLAATTAPPAEKGASLYLADDAGQRYPLTEKTSGSYQSDSLQLNAARQYQLRITTAGQVGYASDLVPLKITPPIDNVGWKLDGSQIQVQLSTHDASQQSRYYRWRFAETWEFHAAFESHLEYYPHPVSGQSTIDLRTTPIFTCWHSEAPSVIKQGTSAQLSQDALTDVLLYTVATNAERVKIRYSVLVSQAAETAAEFAYYELLRKNTEAVGGVNDPLPTQLTGNVHRLDQATEPVLGFVSAHTVQTKRLFIDHTQLPFLADYQYITPYTSCTLGALYFCDLNGKCDVPGVYQILSLPGTVPIDYARDPISKSDGYTTATTDCADCRTRGTTTKPSFW